MARVLACWITLTGLMASSMQRTSCKHCCPRICQHDCLLAGIHVVRPSTFLRTPPHLSIKGGSEPATNRGGTLLLATSRAMRTPACTACTRGDPYVATGAAMHAHVGSFWCHRGSTASGTASTMSPQQACHQLTCAQNAEGIGCQAPFFA
jgi:hypothetical protein